MSEKNPGTGTGGFLFDPRPTIEAATARLPNRRIVIAASGWNPFLPSSWSQQAGLRGAAVIAIAADSEVDAIDVYPDGNTASGNRQRISVEHPLVGPIDFDTAVFAPVCPVPDLSGYATIPRSVGGSVPSSMASLVHAAIDVVFDPQAIALQVGKRAPGRWAWGTGGALSNNQVISYFVPCIGRRTVSILVYAQADPDAANTLVTFAGVQAAVIGTAAAPTVLALVDTATAGVAPTGGAGLEVSEMFDAAPWQAGILVTLTNGPASAGSTPRVTAITRD